MPTYSGEINNFVVGDDLDIERTISNIPTGQTITKAWLTIKEIEAGSTAVLSKEITSVATSSGVISDTGADTVGVVTFTLTAAETALFSAGNWLYYDIQVKTSGGKIYTPEKGRIKGEIQLTSATS